MPKYVLSRRLGDGTDENPYRPAVADVGDFAASELRDGEFVCEVENKIRPPAGDTEITRSTIAAVRAAKGLSVKPGRDLSEDIKLLLEDDEIKRKEAEQGGKGAVSR